MKSYSISLFILVFLLPVLLDGQQAYWQQEVNYKIAVKLDDNQHTLKGKIEFEYINNSPDTLREIYMHLWPNAYKHRSTAYAQEQANNGKVDFHLSSKQERGYIDRLSFKIDDRSVKMEYDAANPDIALLKLRSPLMPGRKCVIETPFHVKIPHTFSRFGHVKQDYQICQWYPKPAVYDFKGWHPMTYRDQGEFYAEFGSFEVYIDIPADYVVGATGILQDEEEVEWMHSLSEETKAFIKDGKRFSDEFANRKGRKILKYTQDNIHDFAWFASKDYRVHSSTAKLESGKEVRTWALFYEKDIDSWQHVSGYVNDALFYFSKWLGDYPYEHCTAVQGPLLAGGGMEYPMITIIGDNILDHKVLDEIIAHEVGHNWFQGILGSNERDYPWMDEGLNSFYEARYMKKKYGSDMALPSKINRWAGLHMGLRELSYQLTVNQHKDQPIGLHSHDFTSSNYGIMVYMGTPLMLNGLEAYLGLEDFDKLMQGYYEKWKFKHPYPKDLKSSFEEGSKDVSFFFDEIIPTNDKIDYKFVKKEKNNEKIGGIPYARLKVKNKGFVASPFTISGIKGDSAINTTWYNGFNGEMEVLFKDGDYDYYKIDVNNDFPDINKKNNTLRSKGFFPTLLPLKLKPFISFEDPNYTEVLFSPLALWNAHDGNMLGVGIYNGFLFEKIVEYGFSPMYGLKSKNMVGSGRLGVNFKALSSLSIRKVSMDFSATRFSYDNHDVLGALSYSRLVSKTRFLFRKKKEEPNIERSLNVRTGLFFQNYAKKYITYYDKEEIWEEKTRQYNLVDALYRVDNNGGLSPSVTDIRLEAGERLIKADFTYNTKVNFTKKSNMHLRFFAGAFLYNKNTSDVDYRYRMSAYQGKHDYWHDDLYLGRSINTGIWSQQAYTNGGNFKTLTPVGQTSNWLTAINLDFSLPWKLPIRLFADIGTYHNAGYDVPGYTDWVMYDLGLCFKTGLLNIYLPLVVSPDIKRALDLNTTKYVQRISFFVDLNFFKPQKLRESMGI